MALFFRFLRDDRAATAIEYAMIGAFISVLIVVGARAIGINLQTTFYNPIANGLS